LKAANAVSMWRSRVPANGRYLQYAAAGSIDSRAWVPQASEISRTTSTSAKRGPRLCRAGNPTGMEPESRSRCPSFKPCGGGAGPCIRRWFVTGYRIDIVSGFRAARTLSVGGRNATAASYHSGATAPADRERLRQLCARRARVEACRVWSTAGGRIMVENWRSCMHYSRRWLLHR